MKKICKNKLYLIFILIFFLSLAIFSFSSENLSNIDYIHKPDSKISILPIYNLASTYSIADNCHVILGTSFFLYHPTSIADNIGCHYYNENIKNDLNTNNTKKEYFPGFQISLGVRNLKDDWNIIFDYLRIHIKNKNTSKLSEYDKNTSYYIGRSMFSYSLDNTPQYLKGNLLSSEYKVFLDSIDFLILRSCYKSKQLVFTIQTGLSGGKIYQKCESYIFNTLENFENKYQYCSDQWLLGSKFVFQSLWNFIYQLSLQGTFSTGLYFGFDAINAIETAHHTTQSKINCIRKSRKLIPVYGQQLGFNYQKYFDNRQWHLNISILYGFTYFFNLNENIKITEKPKALMYFKNFDFNLQGFSFEVQIDF